MWDSPWGIEWERFLDPELRPLLCTAGVTFVAGWVLFTPLRRVVWTFVLAVWAVACLNFSLCSDCITRFQRVAQAPGISALRGPAYAFALMGAMLSVPGLVLKDEKEKYGKYGEVLRSWWETYRITFYEYLPELTQNTYESSKKYLAASWDACVTIGTRVGEVVMSLGWVVLLLISLAIHVPMTVYDLLEFFCCGGVGLACVLVTLNALNYGMELTKWGLHYSGGIVVVGLITHAWRQGSTIHKLEGVAPAAVLENALRSVSSSSTARSRREEANIRRLREDVEVLEDFQDADDGNESVARLETVNTKLYETQEVIIDDPLPPPGQVSVGPTYPRDVRRGRQTLSQGECHESWQDASPLATGPRPRSGFSQGPQPTGMATSGVAYIV